MRHTLFILLSLISFSAFNQITHKRIDLLWQEASFFYKNNLKTDRLSFEGVQYSDSAANIPLYHFLVKIKNEGDVYSINNAKYIKLSDAERDILNDKENLNQDFVLKQVNKIKNKKLYADISITCVRKNNSYYEKLVSFELKIDDYTKPKITSKFKSGKRNITNSILRNGNWYKISVPDAGVYKITYDQLVSMGIDNPADVGIFGYGSGELSVSNSIDNIKDLPSNALYFNKGSDGEFNTGDYLLFYAQGSRKFSYIDNLLVHENNTYSHESFYFISSDHPYSLPIEIKTQNNSYDLEINSFEDYKIIDDDEINLIQSGRLWLGDRFDVETSRDYDFLCPNLIKDEIIRLQLSLLARSGGGSSFQVKANDSFLSNIDIPAVMISSSTSKYANIVEHDLDFKSTSDNVKINLDFNKYSASSVGWLNYMKLQFMRKLIFTDNYMLFRNNKNVSSKSKFILKNISENTLVWDISDVHNITNINYQKDKGSAIFTLDNTQHKEFLAFDSSADFPSPKLIGSIENQNLHSLHSLDMIILSPNSLISQANRLAGFHKQEGLRVFVASSEKIYNEFSSGAFSAIAIRDFMRMLYNKALNEDDMPKYLLLFGDGSYDNKKELSLNNKLLPSFQSLSSLSPVESFVTDDFYALLDDNEGGTSGIMDLGVGRLPISNMDQAKIMVDKIINYSKPTNIDQWITNICFIADDEDNNIHMRDANYLASYLEKEYGQYNVKRMFLDDYVQEVSSAGERYPELNKEFTKQVNKGSLIINYTGHGSENGLAHEKILTIDDIASWTNKYLPLFMTATCEFSRFDNYNKISAGEYMLLKENTGAIGLFTTTRLVFSNPNFLLNKNFYENVFLKDNKSQFFRLGDIMRKTKNSMIESVNKRSFTLLGDPALKLNYPDYEIKLISIFNDRLDVKTDTIKAFDKIRVSGEILDLDGSRLDSYSGVLDVVVYDKNKDSQTKGNDGEVFIYKKQKNIIYKGRASVSKGIFSFKFVVPKDIMYKYGYGKILFFSHKNDVSASGVYKDFIVGGSSENIINDKQGPYIDLFIDDENFVDGQVVSENPMLLALLNDESGINTIGNSVGHDITLVMNDEQEKQIVLNEYYEADVDSFEKGKIKYNFSKLKNGEYTLSLKVWDNVNNSNEKKIEFLVSDNANLVISHLLNYPNPFTSNTSFYFEHNSIAPEIEVLIQILTISGNLVKTIETRIMTNSNRVGPIAWDGTDDYGNRIGRGVYFYKLKIRNDKGQYAEKYQKIVLLK